MKHTFSHPLFHGERTEEKELTKISEQQNESDGDPVDERLQAYEKKHATPSIRPAEIRQLDRSTIATEFLPRVRDGAGRMIDPKAAAFDSPFSNQEDQEGNLYPDGWKPVRIRKNTILYQLSGPEGTKSCYFTDRKTIDSCRIPKTDRIDLELLKSKLQIPDPDHLKTTLTAFSVRAESGVTAAAGSACENDPYGIGGGRQYFIPHANQYKRPDSGVLVEIPDRSRRPVETP